MPALPRRVLSPALLRHRLCRRDDVNRSTVERRLIGVLTTCRGVAPQALVMLRNLLRAFPRRDRHELPHDLPR
jgi:hypothetical protein